MKTKLTEAQQKFMTKPKEIVAMDAAYYEGLNKIARDEANQLRRDNEKINRDLALLKAKLQGMIEVVKHLNNVVNLF